jgi:hypothetical protein
MLHPSPTSQMFSTTTSHSIYYESQKPQVYVVQVFDTNGSQSLLTLTRRVQKRSSSSFKHYNLKIYGVKNIEIFSTFFHANFRPDPVVKFL